MGHFSVAVLASAMLGQWREQRNRLQAEFDSEQQDLPSDISVLDRKAQNAALRAQQEISRSDVDGCRGQAVAFNKQTEALRSEIMVLERSNKDI